MTKKPMPERERELEAQANFNLFGKGKAGDVLLTKVTLPSSHLAPFPHPPHEV